MSSKSAMAAELLIEMAKKSTGRSTAPINSVFSLFNLPHNIAQAEKSYKAGQEGSVLGNALRETFKGKEGAWDSFQLGKNRYSGKAIAGAGSMLGIGYRVASGGGIYRDSDGEFDVAGVPFL